MTVSQVTQHVKSRIVLCVAIALSLTGYALFSRADEESQPTAQRLDSLSWLAGDWISESSKEVVEEQWMAPRGNMMLGMNRTVRNKRTMFEFLRIEEKEGKLTFLASPMGEPATPFRATEVARNRITFENRENDFPHTISYWREDELLRAKIEGPINGKTTSLEWTWKRAAKTSP